jgi:hypothetical protein
MKRLLFAVGFIILLLLFPFNTYAPQIQKAYDSLVKPHIQAVVPSTADAPAVKSDGEQSKNLVWKYNGQQYAMQVVVPNSLLDWDHQVFLQVGDFYRNNGYKQTISLKTATENVKQLILANSTDSGGNFLPYIDEPNNAAWSARLAEALSQRAKVQGYNYFRQAEFIQSFVGYITYQQTSVAELPAQTVMDNGDCKDKTILLATLLKSLGYRVVMLDFMPQQGEQGHMALGVAFDENQLPHRQSLYYYTYNGARYYYAETTEPGWRIGQASLNEPAHVFVVN